MGEHGEKEKVACTGRKFYDEQGNLLADEGAKGAINQVIVLPDEFLKDFNIALERGEKFGNFYDLNEIVSKHGIKYNYYISGQNLYVNEKLSFFDTFKMFAHFAGEGAVMGYSSERFSNNNPGLAKHYESCFTARDYWSKRTQLIEFKPWWK